MIEASFIVLEDAIRSKAAAAEVYEGQPVSLDVDGNLVAATSAMKVYGVSKLDSNQYRDFAYGEFGAFGTGKLTVVCQGIVRVKASVYNKVEIGTDPAAVVVNQLIYKTGLTYVPGEPLYVDADGLISNAAAVNKISFLGRVVAAPATDGDWLELELMKGFAVGEIAAQD